MPVSSLWSFIIALIVLALGFALKVAQLMHRLDDVQKKLASADSEFKSFQKQKEEEISNIKKLHDTRVKELEVTITHQQSLADKSRQSQSLDKPKINILKLLFSQNMSTEQIADSLGFQRQTAVYHLEELANFNMVILQRYSRHVPGDILNGYMPSIQRFSVWTLKQAGRKYLIDNKLET